MSMPRLMSMRGCSPQSPYSVLLDGPNKRVYSNRGDTKVRKEFLVGRGGSSYDEY